MGGRREGGALRSDSSESCGEARIAKKPDQGAGQVPQTTNKQTNRQGDKCTLQASQWAVGTAQHGSQKLAFVIGRAGRLLRGAHPQRQRGCSTTAVPCSIPATLAPAGMVVAAIMWTSAGGVLWPLRSHLLLRRFSHGTRADSTVSCFTCRPARPPPGPVPQSLGSPARQAWWEQVLQ